MTKYKYFIWIRWVSGARDVFELSKRSYEGLKNPIYTICRIEDVWTLESSTLECIEIKVESIAAKKLIKKQINPLDEDGHYDNPLN